MHILEEEVLYAIAKSETSFINHVAVNPRFVLNIIVEMSKAALYIYIYIYIGSGCGRGRWSSG